MEATTRKKFELIGGTKHARHVNQSECERAWVVGDGEVDTDTKIEPDSENITVTFTCFECFCPNLVNNEEFSGNCPTARRGVTVGKRKPGARNRSDEYME